MPVWLISFFFAAGATAFIYAKLIHSTGDADHRQTVIATSVAFVMIYIVLFTFCKFVLGFD